MLPPARVGEGRGGRPGSRGVSWGNTAPGGCAAHCSGVPRRCWSPWRSASARSRWPSGGEQARGRPASSALLAESTCDQTLKVVTASSFAKVLATLEPSLATGPHCVALDTAVVDGRDAAARVAEREADVWIPDDLSWAAVARGGLLADDGKGGSGTVLATSPIYMVTDTATAARLTGAGGSWLALSKLVAAPDGVRLAVRDPNGSGDGMVAAGSLGEAVWIKDGMDASSAALSAALRQTRTVPGTAPALPDQPGEVGLVPEYALLAAKRTAEDAAVLAGHRPHRRAPVRLAADRRRGRRPGPQGRAGPAAGRAEEPGRGQGVRGGGAAPAQRRAAPGDGDVRLPRLTAPPLDVLEPHHVDHVFAAWYVQDRRSSILLAVDVSGSMGQPAPGTARR